MYYIRAQPVLKRFARHSTFSTESTTFYTPCQGVMEGRWKNRLHFNLLGENVLVDGLHLDSAWSFFLASCLTVFICSSER